MSTFMNKKKRTVDEMEHSRDDDNVMAIIARLQQDIQQLKEDTIAGLQLDVQKLKEENKILKDQVESLKAAVAEQPAKEQARQEEDEESDDDDDDDNETESVCDGSPWSEKYFMLKQYKQENGDCKVHRSHKALGVWVNNTRVNRRKNQLAQDRIDKLDKIGFHWGKGFPEPATWEESFQKLKAYHANFGHCNIHIDADPARQTDLAKWVLEQRKQGKRLRKMKPGDMNMEQYKMLQGIGFKWKLPKKASARGS